MMECKSAIKKIKILEKLKELDGIDFKASDYGLDGRSLRWLYDIRPFYIGKSFKCVETVGTEKVEIRLPNHCKNIEREIKIYKINLNQINEVLPLLKRIVAINLYEARNLKKSYVEFYDKQIQEMEEILGD